MSWRNRRKGGTSSPQFATRTMAAGSSRATPSTVTRWSGLVTDGSAANARITYAAIFQRRFSATPVPAINRASRSEEHTSELQSRLHLVCRLLLEKKKKKTHITATTYH